MRSRQRGATFLGLLVIALIIGSGLYAGIRLLPIYFEYMAVVRAMEQTAEELSGSTTSPQTMRTSLNRRWSIEDIKSVQPKEMEFKKTGTGYTMRAWYRAEVPFLGNISLVADFDKTVDVKGP
jgi:hypothetical protein